MTFEQWWEKNKNNWVYYDTPYANVVKDAAESAWQAAMIVKNSAYTTPKEETPVKNFKIQGLNPVTHDWDTLKS
jgi:hypothetical protein